jgi:hypothetical protein
MVLALKMTSVVFAAAMALRTAHAIAMAMCWTNAENAAVMALLTAHAIAMETYWMPWVNVEDPVLPTSMRMAFAMISSNRVARILLLAITMKARQKTTAPAITVPVAK